MVLRHFNSWIYTPGACKCVGWNFSQAWDSGSGDKAWVTGEKLHGWPKIVQVGMFSKNSGLHTASQSDIAAASHPLDPYLKFSLWLEYGRFVLMGQALEEPSTIQSFSFIITSKTNLLLKWPFLQFFFQKAGCSLDESNSFRESSNFILPTRCNVCMPIRTNHLYNTKDWTLVMQHSVLWEDWM